METVRVYLHDVATTVPEAYYTQETALSIMKGLISDSDETAKFLDRIYRSSAIGKRHTVINDYGKRPEEYLFYPRTSDMKPEPTPKMRNDLYIREANRLSLEAVRKLMDRLPNVDPGTITHMITVSCTGFSAPGFDVHIVRELRLNPRISRFHVGFMGCYAAFPAMNLARSICIADPGSRILVVNTELCSIHLQQSRELEIIIANMLFADGVSAALISSNPGDSSGNRILLHRFFSRILGGSEDKMAWSIGNTAFDMKLSAYIPQILNENILPVLSDFYRDSGTTRDDISIWAIHPGGRAILDRLGKTLGLGKEDLSDAYDILRDYGNMSSATIMFLLERILAGDRRGNIFSAAFGPGLTVETAFMEKI